MPRHLARLEAFVNCEGGERCRIFLFYELIDVLCRRGDERKFQKDFLFFSLIC